MALRNDGCFVCGQSNPIGLRLRFEYDRENHRATGSVTFKPEHQGWDRVVHGGILTAVLDDVMAHALMTTDKLGITTRMNASFRKPVYVGETVFLEGEVIELKSRIARTRGIVYTIEGEGSDGRIIRCEAEATYYLDALKTGS